MTDSITPDVFYQNLLTNPTPYLSYTPIEIELECVEDLYQEFTSHPSCQSISFSQFCDGLFDYLNIYETCHRIRIEGEYLFEQFNLLKFVGLEILEISYFKFNGLSCDDLPISLRHLDIRDHHSMSIEGIDRLCNIETLIIDGINTYQMTINLPNLRTLIVVGSKCSSEFLASIDKNRCHIQFGD